MALVCNHRPMISTQMSLLVSTVSSDSLLVSLFGNSSGIVDIKLAEKNLTRRIAMTTNSFASAVSLVKQTSLVCVLPYAIAFEHVRNGSLIAKPMPIDIPPAEISMAWHNRINRDAGLTWLRDTISQIVHNKQELFKNDAWVN